jgi:uroporphyrinogen decarboxylase
MHTETMTPLERWHAVLSRQKPDRVPMDFWGTPEITEKLIGHFGCTTRQEMLQKLRVDFVVGVAPQYVGPALPANTDPFGKRTRTIHYPTGAYDETIYYPLADYHSVAEIEAHYTWPTPDWWDYRAIPQQIQGWEDYPIQGGGSEPFLTYKDLRGQEQAMLDLVENPEMVHYCLDKLFDLAYQNTLRIMEAIPNKLTYIYVAEDLGGQRNLLFSPAHIRTYLLPRMQRMVELGHQGGAYVFHHDDGNIIRILPELVGLGIDILNPIQWRADGMAREMLKEEYGSRLVFHGGMDNQYTLPFGSVPEVRQEVLDNLRILGEGGGYILAPCHNIQPNTPIENIIAMYETAYAEGWT